MKKDSIDLLKGDLVKARANNEVLYNAILELVPYDQITVDNIIQLTKNENGTRYERDGMEVARDIVKKKIKSGISVDDVILLIDLHNRLQQRNYGFYLFDDTGFDLFKEVNFIGGDFDYHEGGFTTVMFEKFRPNKVIALNFYKQVIQYTESFSVLLDFLQFEHSYSEERCATELKEVTLWRLLDLRSKLSPVEILQVLIALGKNLSQGLREPSDLEIRRAKHFLEYAEAKMSVAAQNDEDNVFKDMIIELSNVGDGDIAKFAKNLLIMYYDPKFDAQVVLARCLDA